MTSAHNSTPTTTNTPTTTHLFTPARYRVTPGQDT